MAERVHWLLEAARRAGMPFAEAASVDAAASLTDAWTAVARAAHVSEDDLARRIATHYRLGAADLQAAEPRALSLVPEKVARRHSVFPLRETDRQLVVATANPNDLETEQAIAFASGRTTVFEVAHPAAILTAIDAHYAPDRLVETLLDRVGAEVAEDIRLVEDVAPETLGAQTPSGRGRATSISSRVAMAGQCGFAWMACCAPTCSSRCRPSAGWCRASRSCPKWTSPIGCARRMAARESRRTAARSTCAFPRCPRATPRKP